LLAGRLAAGWGGWMAGVSGWQGWMAEVAAWDGWLE
jgi:hypothetical protein